MSAKNKTSLKKTVMLLIATGFGFSLALLIPETLLVYNYLLPEDAMPVLSSVSMVLSLMIPTVIFCRNRKNAAAIGGIALLGYLVIMLLIGFCVCGGDVFGMNLVWQTASAAFGSALGIMVSIRKHSRGKRRMKR